MPILNNIFYTEKGKGFPVVLIHGFCETNSIWEEFSNHLPDDLRIITIDLPGFGKSNSLKPPFSIDQVGVAVINFLSEINIHSCVLVGHSLGGYIALSIADQKPEMVNGFVLFHSTAYADSEEKKASRNKVIEFVENNGVEKFIESFIPPLFYNQANPNVSGLVKQASQTPKETVINYTKAMRDRPERIQFIQSFGGPILFLAGEADSVIPIDMVKRQSAIAKNGFFKPFGKVGHMGMLEEVVLTANALTEFLSKVPRSLKSG